MFACGRASSTPGAGGAFWLMGWSGVPRGWSPVASGGSAGVWAGGLLSAGAYPVRPVPAGRDCLPTGRGVVSLGRQGGVVFDMRGRAGDVFLRAVAFPAGRGRRVLVDGRGRVPGIGFAGCVPAAGGCFRRRRSSWGGNGSFRSRRDGVARGRGRRLDGFGAGRGTAVTGWRGAVWLVSVPVERELRLGAGSVETRGRAEEVCAGADAVAFPVGCGRRGLIERLGRGASRVLVSRVAPGARRVVCYRRRRFSGGEGIRLLPFSAGRCCLWLRMGPPLGWVWGRARDGGYGMVPVGSGTGRGGVWGGGPLIWVGGRSMWFPSGAGDRFWLVGWGGVSKAVCFRRCRFFGGWFGSFRFRRGGSRVPFRIGPGNRVYGRDIPVEWELRPRRGPLVWVGGRAIFAGGRAWFPSGAEDGFWLVGWRGVSGGGRFRRWSPVAFGGAAGVGDGLFACGGVGLSGGGFGSFRCRRGRFWRGVRAV